MAPVRATTAAILAVFLGGVFLAGCNTMEGLGQDVQAGGKTLESAADKNKPR